MKITDETIKKIESIFGFPLYEWQKEYLKRETEIITYGRCNGKTFAYILRLLLSRKRKIKKEDLEGYADGYFTETRYSEWICSGKYKRWFIMECLKINQKLVENGFETIII